MIVVDFRAAFKIHTFSLRMCFSQSASFGAAGVLAGIGVAAMSRARDPVQKTVALMPLLFAAQQATEGVLWLALSHQKAAAWAAPAKYSFLVFAEMLWPIYMPLIALMAGSSGRVRKLQAALWAFGILLAAQLAYGMIGWPVYASIRDGHIFYDLRYPPVNTVYYGGLYFLATVVPLMLSPVRMVKLLGLGLIVSYAASRSFYNHYVISIWCYFSAFLSVLSLFLIQRLGQRTAGPEVTASSQCPNTQGPAR